MKNGNMRRDRNELVAGRSHLARCIRTADEVAQEAQLTKLWVLDVVRARLERVACSNGTTRKLNSVCRRRPCARSR
eukprot:6214530-Pleurochrysis_carterae.AAC.1